jgi:type I restriction enzyme S subunit
MQQLLTGETRLPGFEGEWERKILGDYGVFMKGSGIKKDEAKSGEIPCVRYGELYTKHHEYIKSFYSFITSDVAKTAVGLKQGDVLFAGSGETKEEIGKCAVFLEECEAYAGGDIVIYRPEELDSLFLGFYLNTAGANQQKSSKAQGDAVVHISASALSNLVVYLPIDMKEQTAIASILSDMDSEITALEKRRGKTADLKKGMMQELLTGKTRLVKAGASHA